jgi:SAM-dependent methyltransferase
MLNPSQARELLMTRAIPRPAFRTHEKDTMTAATRNSDFADIKSRQQGAWSTGNYAVVGTTLQVVGENLCEALDLRSGSRVLDVAAGNGNATLAAARRWCDVTSTDYVPELLAAGRRRAEADGLEVRFREADAEALPFRDGEFDVVLSTFGVMFTPDQEKAAAEMLRVCRPGGKIGLANWTPDGFIGQLFRTIGRFLPPPAGLTPPSAWGTEARLKELFPGARIDASRRHFVFRYRSTEHWLDVFRTYYGPINRAYAALDVARHAEFTAALHDLMNRVNRSGNGTLVAPSEYLEVVIVKGR